MKFKAIIFDAGDILFDATPWRKWLTAQLRLCGVTITYSQLVEKWESLLTDVYVGKANYWERFERLLISVGLSDQDIKKLKEAAKQKGKDVQIGRKPFKGVPETLAELKKHGIKLIVLSDTESTAEKVHQGLQELGIDCYFDEVITSFDIKAVKPQPKAYEAALKNLSVHNEEAIFVGHDADELDGAMKIGMVAVSYNNSKAVPATYHIRYFTELRQLVCREP